MMIRSHLLILSVLICSLNTWSQNCNLSTVYFKPGKYKLTKDNRHQIDSVLSGFRFQDKYLVELHGLADTTQSAEYNFELVSKRINSVQDYISSKGYKVYFIVKNSGEGIIQMQGNAASRRVDIWYRMLDDNYSVRITGEYGENISIPIESFGKCGFCTTDLKLKSEWKTDGIGSNQTERYLSSSIETSCDSFLSRESCKTFEWRIPSSLYNSSDRLMMPVPLELRSCGTRDSIPVDYLDRVKTEFDTLRLEYVITVPCQLFGGGICCGGLRIVDCPKYQFVFPEKLTAIRNYFSGYKDSTYIEADSLYDYCFYPVVSYGFMNGKFVYLTNDRSFETSAHYIPGYGRERAYFVATYKEEDYASLAYSKIKVNVKAARNVQIDSVSFFVPEYSLAIPFDKLTKRSYAHARLEKKLFQYAVYSQGKLYLFYSGELKSKYNKKKKILKVVVRKRNLTTPSGPKEIIVLPGS